MNEDILKAYQSAEFLCAELREAHKKLCNDMPTLTQKLAERHVLRLLNEAVLLKAELGGLAE
jgi:hypothetical protein